MPEHDDQRGDASSPDPATNDLPAIFSLPPGWLPEDHPAVNPDCDVRVVARASDACWLPAQGGSVEIRMLEYLPDDDGRLTLLCRTLGTPDGPASLHFCANTELYLLAGSVQCGERQWLPGHYVRRPDCDDAGLLFEPAASGSAVPLAGMAAIDDASAPVPAMLYASTGQLAATDTEYRAIDTGDEDRWLPGPVDGTEVLPLHGHGTSNAMLVRWLRQVAFQPRLDPLGEEVLVIAGVLHDASGDYPVGTWIRNPVPAWQSWGGEPGTVVLYKSGHFFGARPDPDAADAAAPPVRPPTT